MGIHRYNQLMIIEADDEQDAKKKLLHGIPHNGEFTVEGYAEFINDIEVEDCRLVGW